MAARWISYVAWSDAAGLVMSHYDATNMPEGKLAQQYMMMDNFFHAAFGGSFLNHFFLVCACTPQFPNAPDTIKAQLDTNGMMTKDGEVTPDGYAINTSYSVNTPHPKTADPSVLVPNQTMPNIGDRLSGKNIDWAWYSGGWNDAIAGNPAPLFQFHHQPFAFFAPPRMALPPRRSTSRTSRISSRTRRMAPCPLSRSSSRSGRTTSTRAMHRSRRGSSTSRISSPTSAISATCGSNCRDAEWCGAITAPLPVGRPLKVQTSGSRRPNGSCSKC